ncbi:MAG: pilin [Candidatus Pacebacteria bacterium]|nr:pilin [Candidatus Paceibacterota bacterium]
MNFKKIFAILAVAAIIIPNGFILAEGSCRITNSDRLSTFQNEGLYCSSTCNYVTDPMNSAYGDCGTCCVLNTVYNVVDWGFLAIMAAAVIMIVLGAAGYLMSGGDADKLKNANNKILYAAIGIVIALLAKAVPSVVLSVMR